MVKKTFLFLVTVQFPFLLFIQTYTGPFRSLTPLLNKTRKGDFKSPTGEVISTVELKFETISEGKVVKAIRKTEKNGGWSEHYLYWNDIEKKVAYFSIEKTVCSVKVL